MRKLTAILVCSVVFLAATSNSEDFYYTVRVDGKEHSFNIPAHNYGFFKSELFKWLDYISAGYYSALNCKYADHENDKISIDFYKSSYFKPNDQGAYAEESYNAAETDARRLGNKLIFECKNKSEPLVTVESVRPTATGGLQVGLYIRGKAQPNRFYVDTMGEKTIIRDRMNEEYKNDPWKSVKVSFSKEELQLLKTRDLKFFIRKEIITIPVLL